MKITRILMGMPISVEVNSPGENEQVIKKVFNYFKWVDDTFSTYKESSEVSRFNAGILKTDDLSIDVKNIFRLSEKTKNETAGYFDIYNGGKCDPSGIVKGWSILKAANIICDAGFNNYYIEAGGDIQVSGLNKLDEKWRIGIRNPLDTAQIVKVIALSDQGIATSGTYLRGDHIYNPHTNQVVSNNILSLSVIGPDVYEADRFATAAFAMGKEGVNFIEKLSGFDAYQINKYGQATMTSGFKNYVLS